MSGGGVTLMHDGNEVTYTLNGTDISREVNSGPLSEEGERLEWRGSGGHAMDVLPGQATNEITLNIRMNGTTWPLIRPLLRTVPRPTAELVIGYPWGESDTLTVRAMSKDPTTEANETMAMEITFAIEGTLAA